MVKKNLLNVKKACHRNRVIVTDEDGHTDFSLSLFTLHLTAYSLVKLIVGCTQWSDPYMGCCQCVSLCHDVLLNFSSGL